MEGAAEVGGAHPRNIGDVAQLDVACQVFLDIVFHQTKPPRRQSAAIFSPGLRDTEPRETNSDFTTEAFDIQRAEKARAFQLGLNLAHLSGNGAVFQVDPERKVEPVTVSAMMNVGIEDRWVEKNDKMTDDLGII